MSPRRLAGEPPIAYGFGGGSGGPGADGSSHYESRCRAAPSVRISCGKKALAPIAVKLTPRSGGTYSRHADGDLEELPVRPVAGAVARPVWSRP